LSEILRDNLRHVLFALLLTARIGDLATTYLMTPGLVLESNPIVRRLGWRYALITSAVCVVPYFSAQIAVSLVVASLLVSASNAARVWVARTMGEEAQLEFMVTLARRGKLSHALLGVLASAFFVVLTGCVVFLFYSRFRDWGFWIGLGIVGYGVVIGFHGSIFMVRVFQKARTQGDTSVQPPPKNEMQLTSHG